MPCKAIKQNKVSPPGEGVERLGEKYYQTCGKKSCAQLSDKQVSDIAGVEALNSLLTDRTFVCLHYRLGPDGILAPCTAGGLTSVSLNHICAQQSCR